NPAAPHGPTSSSTCASPSCTSSWRRAGSTLSSAPADEPLSKTPYRLALLGLPTKLGIGVEDPILPLRRDARMCAAISNRPDPRPPSPFSTALNSRGINRQKRKASRSGPADHREGGAELRPGRQAQAYTLICTRPKKKARHEPKSYAEPNTRQPS